MDKREAKLRADYAASKAQANGCRLWRWKSDTNGYGIFRHGYKQEKAHIAIYELFVGPIPDGLEIDHLCRVRNCVWPPHLEAVTHRENVLRGNGHAGINARKTHCLNGHEFTSENTGVNGKNGRACLTCRRVPEKEPWTHCLEGHEMTEANTIWRSEKSRRCRACKNQAEKMRKRLLQET